MFYKYFNKYIESQFFNIDYRFDITRFYSNVSRDTFIYTINSNVTYHGVIPNVSVY